MKPPELLSPNQFYKEIKPLFAKGVMVQGFVLTVRTDKSTMQMKWGSNRIKRWLRSKDTK